MYVHAHDPDRGLAVWYFRNMGADDWDAHFGHLQELATWSKRIGRRAACMMIPASFSLPDAKRRAELARNTELPGYDPYVAFIAPNAALQGALTVMSWLQKQPQYESKFLTNVDAGRRWLEERRGERLDKLGVMIEDVLARANARSAAM